jgi:hypothetical protein
LPESHALTVTAARAGAAGAIAWTVFLPPTGYVVSFYPATATPISTAINTAGKPIKVGSPPDAIAITS